MAIFHIVISTVGLYRASGPEPKLWLPSLKMVCVMPASDDARVNQDGFIRVRCSGKIPAGRRQRTRLEAMQTCVYYAKTCLGGRIGLS